MTVNKNNDYNENSIKKLGFPLNVQKRPTMYIGSLGLEGNNHLVKEIIDNSVDEALNGFGNEIKITISNKEGFCKVEDKGRGIPPKAIETAFTVLHASGKFDNESYATSGGLNGVGASCVNALSTMFIVETCRDGKKYMQAFEKGYKKTNLEEVGKAKNTGTVIEFYPNEEIMGTYEFDMGYIKNEIEMKSFINSGLKFILIDEDKNKKYEFYHKSGLKEYISEYYNKNLITDIISFDTEVECEVSKNVNRKIPISVAFAYSKSGPLIIKSFCNSLYTSEGGKQETGFKIGMTNIIKNYIRDNKLLNKKEEKLPINGSDIQDGLVALISLKHPAPEYKSQIKSELTNNELQGALQKAVNSCFGEYAENNPKVMKIICQKVIVSAKAAEAARKAKDQINKKLDSISSISDLSKLSSCISKDPEERELFIVEGQSAGGTSKSCRDKKYQAIYALRGKPLNSINATMDSINKNKELSDLIYVITGKKYLNQEEKFTSQYGKVIIMADADSDGYHISTLMSAFIYTYLNSVINNGNLYIACPPLYSIIEKGKKRYFLDQEEYDKYIMEKIIDNFTIDIYKNDKIINLNVSNLEKVINQYKKLFKIIKENSIVNQCDLNFLDLLVGYLPYKDISEILKDIKNENDIIIKKNKKDISIEGICFGNFISIPSLNKIIKIANKIIDSFDNLPEVIINEEDPLTINNYQKILENVTPKSRNRMKGLGKHFAP